MTDNLTRAAFLVNHLLDEYQLTPQGWTFKGFNNSKHTAGNCSFNRIKKSGTVGLSKILTETQDWEEVEDTITHEVAHAIDYSRRGQSDHSYTWKAIHRELGGTGERTFRLQSSHILDMNFAYIGYCERCEKIVDGWSRKPKYSTYRHKPCGGGVITIKDGNDRTTVAEHKKAKALASLMDSI